MVYIKASGIDKQVRTEADRRRESRRTEDIRKGLTRSSDPQRGDYGLCRELDKTLKDFHGFKDPKDRAKINAEYYGKQKEYRNSKVLGK